MVKNIKGLKMKEVTGHLQNIHGYAFPGANIDDMNSHITLTMKRNLETMILHCGTSDLGRTDWAQTIKENITDLGKALKQIRTRCLFMEMSPVGIVSTKKKCNSTKIYCKYAYTKRSNLSTTATLILMNI